MVRGANRRRGDTCRAQPPLLRLPTWVAVSDSGAAEPQAQRVPVEQPDRVSCEGAPLVAKQTLTATTRFPVLRPQPAAGMTIVNTL